jgi:recombinational DNA repair ATPase RecF
MTQINRFSEQKINEALGIAEATLFYVDLIKSRCIVEIIDYIGEEPDLNETREENIQFRYTDIKNFVTNWEVYQDYPVSEILIELLITKKNPEILKSVNKTTKRQEIVPFRVGGYASPFARGRERLASRLKDAIKINQDHTISIHLGIDFEFSSNLKLKKDEEKIELILESTILHELNHNFEFYKRKISGKKEIEYTGTYTAIGPNRMRRPKILFEYWQNHFTDYIYMSEPHEIRAYIQESKAYIDKIDFETFKKTNTWKVAKIMESFKYNNFLKGFDKLVYKYNPEYVELFTSTLIKDFKREYLRLSKEYREENTIKPEFINKLSDDQFFKFWEKRINKAGEIIVRKLMRLYSYKKD